MVTTPGVTRRIFVIGRIACILVIPAVVLHLGSAEFLPIKVARLEGAGVYLATFSVSRFIKKGLHNNTASDAYAVTGRAVLTSVSE